jgi:hypothetical protein
MLDFGRFLGNFRDLACLSLPWYKNLPKSNFGQANSGQKSKVLAKETNVLPTICIALSAPTLRALLEYQGQHSELDPATVADLAIRDWLERQRKPERAASQRGYRWKALFLPEGTRLRTSSYTATRYADIVGDDLFYQNQVMSPNQFVQVALGSTRSAWQAIHVRMPGAREWTLALRLRQSQEAEQMRGASRTAKAQGMQPGNPA